MYHSRPSYKKFRQRKKCEHVWYNYLERIDHVTRTIKFDLYRIKLKRCWMHPDKLDVRNMKRAVRFYKSNKETHLREIRLKKFRKWLKEVKEDNNA